MRGRRADLISTHLCRHGVDCEQDAIMGGKSKRKGHTFILTEKGGDNGQAETL